MTGEAARAIDRGNHMVVSHIGQSSQPPLSSRQRRELQAARKTIGEAAAVRAFARGRATARWSAGASWIVGAFAAAFVVAFVFLHVVLIPGALVVLVLYDNVRPRRGVAVTATGVAELKLSTMSGRPSSVLSMTGHAALLQPLDRANGRTVVRVGTEDVSFRDRDLGMLQAAIPVAPLQVAQPPRAVSSAVVPPRPDARVDDASLPRWREATVLWVLAHIGIGFCLFLAIVALANVVGAAFGRNTNETAAGADAVLWGVVAGAMAGWMLFVYRRAAFRLRMLLLGAFAGGALLLACIVNVLYSPPVAR